MDQVTAGNIDVRWHPGQENLADYHSKHHDGAHHEAVRPWYIHTPESVRELPRAATPRTVRGCAGTLAGGYTRTSPLPRVTRAARAAHATHSPPPRVSLDTVLAATHVALAHSTAVGVAQTLLLRAMVPTMAPAISVP